MGHGAFAARRNLLALALFSLCFFGGLTSAQDLVISEFMAVNSSTIVDEDGDSSDWLEIHHQGLDPIDVGGYYLTDNANDLTRWRLPAVTIADGGYLLIYCSEKDRRDPAVAPVEECCPRNWDQHPPSAKHWLPS